MYKLSEWDLASIENNLEANDSGTVMSYSGRHMHGLECLGIVTGNVTKTMMLLAWALTRIGGRGESLVETFVESESRTDSMAFDTVVYFPMIAMPNGYVDPDDIEEEA